MTDALVSGLLQGSGLRLVVATTSGLARHARAVHGARAGAAELLAQGLTAAALLSGLQLQKGPSRVNLQLECDGPLRGLLVDAGTDGTVRGYVKNPLVEVQGSLDAYRYRPVLGNAGFLSVLRDLGGGEYYRSSVELQALDLSLDLERFFESSEQLPTAVFIDSVPAPQEGLGSVAGLVLQPLPGGDRAAMAEHRARLRDRDGFRQVLARAGGLGVDALAQALFPGPDLDLKTRTPLRWQCTCSRERVVGMLRSAGRAELEDMLAKEGRAEVSCTFCSSVYRVSGEELRALLSEQQP